MAAKPSISPPERPPLPFGRIYRTSQLHKTRIKKSARNIRCCIHTSYQHRAGCCSFCRTHLLCAGRTVPGSSGDSHPAELGKSQTQAQVIVAIARAVVVAIGRPAVPGVVVPAAAAIHAVRASQETAPNLSITFLLKLSAWAY